MNMFDRTSFHELNAMDLHDIRWVDKTQIMRVPGGWIYTTWGDSVNWKYPTSVFVPYDNEFYKD